MIMVNTRQKVKEILYSLKLYKRVNASLDWYMQAKPRISIRQKANYVTSVILDAFSYASFFLASEKTRKEFLKETYLDKHAHMYGYKWEDSEA